MPLIALSILRKKVFSWGESAPIWGRYRGLKFGIFAIFGLLLLGTLSTDFRFFDGVRQPLGCSNDAENFVKIKFTEFEQCGFKVGVWGIFGFWARTPISPRPLIGLATLRKTVFVWVESAPIWGKYWGLNFGIFWLFCVLWPTFARNFVYRFSIF